RGPWRLAAWSTVSSTGCRRCVRTSAGSSTGTTPTNLGSAHCTAHVSHRTARCSRGRRRAASPRLSSFRLRSEEPAHHRRRHDPGGSEVVWPPRAGRHPYAAEAGCVAMSAMGDIDDIQQVKYRYLRALDTKHWDDFADTLTDDVIGDYDASIGESHHFTDR